MSSRPAAGLRQIIPDFSDIMKCSAENIHKYRVEGFVSFSSLGWDRLQAGRGVQPPKSRSKNQIPHLESDRYWYQKNGASLVLGEKNRRRRRRAMVSKNKNNEENTQQIQAEKKKSCCFY